MNFTYLTSVPGGLPSPDLMIVHHVCPQDPPPPLELHGFPPWQIALTEIQ
jgi:dehydrodolichyl diphosphate syntase complex subunit NUS1